MFGVENKPATQIKLTRYTKLFARSSNAAAAVLS